MRRVSESREGEKQVKFLGYLAPLFRHPAGNYIDMLTGRRLTKSSVE
jgi:hypothetical protein